VRRPLGLALGEGEGGEGVPRFDVDGQPGRAGGGNKNEPDSSRGEGWGDGMRDGGGCGIGESGLLRKGRSKRRKRWRSHSTH
jgi:hypothetical protein